MRLISIIFVVTLLNCSFQVFASSNIVLILTDDQDLVLDSLDYLPKINNLLRNKGVIFDNAFTSSPICCPSRASILTGDYAHNTQTYNNSREGGCYSDHWIQNHEPYTFPARLHEAGYETFFAGKYLNQYNSDSVPKGYDDFYGLHGNSKYYNYTLNENGKLVKYGENPETDYLPNIIRNRALEFISKQKADKKFFAWLSLPSCHAPFTPEEKYQDFFLNETVPRTKNFNVGAKPHKKHWLMTMEPEILPENVVDLVDESYRKRLETLLTVDDIVESLVLQLSSQNLIDETFIIFTSDNGYHLGQWAMPYDKRLPYETDIRVPLIIRGPHIPAMSTIKTPVMLVDIAPTILTWAKIAVNYGEFDGQPFGHLLMSPSDEIQERQMLIEYWGEGNQATYNPKCKYKKSQRLAQCNPEVACKCEDSWNNTYSCVRHMSESTNFLFCKFSDRESFQEAYDLNNDFYQMENVGFEILPSIQARYQIIVEDLSVCSGDSCREIKPV